MIPCTPVLRSAMGAAFESSTLRSSIAMSVVTVSLIITSVACSLTIPDPGVVVTCSPEAAAAEECPRESEVAFAVEFYADAVDEPGFEREPLLVEWHASAEILGGRADSRHAVRVESFAYLMHELEHVRLWRKEGNPDHNHEEPGGPWIVGTDANINAISLALESEMESCQ